MKSRSAVVEVVVGPVVDGDALRGQAVPGVRVVGKQRRDPRPLVVAEVVPADLRAVVREAEGPRPRLRQQQQAHVLVGVAGEQHEAGGLEELLAVLHVGDAGDPAPVVGLDAPDVGVGHHLQAPGGLGPGNRRHRGRVLRVDVAPAPVAEPVVHAARAPLVGARVDGGGPGEGLPVQRARRVRHALQEAGPAQRGHRVVAGAGALERVAPLVATAGDVAGLPRDADLVLHPVVVRLELGVAEGPVLDRRSLGQARPAVAPRRRRDHLEVPRVEPPALGPVVQGGAADGVHHGVAAALDRGLRLRAPEGRHLVGALLHRERPGPHVVPELVGGEVAAGEASAGLESDHVEPGLGEGKGGDAAGRPEPHDDDVGSRQSSRHGASPRSRRRPPPCRSTRCRRRSGGSARAPRPRAATAAGARPPSARRDSR